MLDFAKEMLWPFSLTYMWLLLTPGIVVLYNKRLAPWGRRWLVLVAAGYWALSCPVTVNLLALTLTYGYTPLVADDVSAPAEAILLLGGGSTNVRFSGQQLSIINGPSGLRVLETARLFKLLGGPLVIVSGGVTERNPGPGSAPESVPYRRALIELGIPAERIVLESRSKNTHDEAFVMKDLVRERGIGTFVLVTSPVHMRRSMSAFRAAGLNPLPAVAPLYPERHGQPFPLLPNEAALEIGDSVVYEWAARLYYWWKGWSI